MVWFHHTQVGQLFCEIENKVGLGWFSMEKKKKILKFTCTSVSLRVWEKQLAGSGRKFAWRGQVQDVWLNRDLELKGLNPAYKICWSYLALTKEGFFWQKELMKHELWLLGRMSAVQIAVQVAEEWSVCRWLTHTGKNIQTDIKIASESGQGARKPVCGSVISLCAYIHMHMEVSVEQDVLFKNVLMWLLHY